MKWIKENKKIIIISVLGIAVFLVCIMLLTNFAKNYKAEKEELGISIYEKAHKLYFYGGNLNYDTKNDIEGYRKISNYEEVTNIISSSLLEKTNKYLNIKQIDGDYYIKPIGIGMSIYYGTTLQLKRAYNNKITYRAITKLCAKDKIVSYNDGCASDGFYEISKPFVIIKENGKWKVAEYTSVFEFTDKELK